MGAKAWTAALAPLQPDPGQSPLLAVATGSCIGEGFTAPPWTPCSSPPRSPLAGASSSTPDGFCGLFPATPLPRCTTTNDTATSVSAASLAKRVPDTPVSDSPTPAASLTRPFRVLLGKSLSRRPITNALLPGTRVSRLGTQPLLNHARQERWRELPTAPYAYSILTSPNKDRNRDVRDGERLPKPLPERMRPGPLDRV
jgi:hypothetical protein